MKSKDFSSNLHGLDPEKYDEDGFLRHHQADNLTEEELMEGLPTEEEWDREFELLYQALLDQGFNESAARNSAHELLNVAYDLVD